MSYIITGTTDSYTPPFSIYDMDIADLKELYIDRIEQYFMSDYTVCNYAFSIQYSKKALAPSDIVNFIFSYMLAFGRFYDTSTIPSFFPIFIYLTFFTQNWTKVNIDTLQSGIDEFFKNTILSTEDFLTSLKNCNLYNYTKEVYPGLYYFINNIYNNIPERVNNQESYNINIIDFFLIYLQEGCPNNIKTDKTIKNKNIQLLITDDKANQTHQNFVEQLKDNPNYILTYNADGQIASIFNKTTGTYLLGGKGDINGG